MGRRDEKDGKDGEAWRRVKFVLFVGEMWWIEIVFVAKM